MLLLLPLLGIFHYTSHFQQEGQQNDSSGVALQLLLMISIFSCYSNTWGHALYDFAVHRDTLDSSWLDQRPCYQTKFVVHSSYSATAVGGCVPVERCVFATGVPLLYIVNHLSAAAAALQPLSPLVV